MGEMGWMGEMGEMFVVTTSVVSSPIIHLLINDQQQRTNNK